MIIVSTFLVSAITGEVTEIARMNIVNVGGTEQIGNYDVRTLHGRGSPQLQRGQTQRESHVSGHPRQREHVWNLVAKGLAAMGYGARK